MSLSAQSPSLRLLVKLGSIVVHADELTQPDGHEADATAIRSLLTDREVIEWLRGMDAQSFLPKKRSSK